MNAPRSQKTSTNAASFSFAAVGIMSSQMMRTYSSGSSRYSGATTCAPSSVGTTVPAH